MKVTRWNGEPISEPGIYSGVPMDVYHGPDLCDGPSISSSGLRTIFTDSPMAYWIESPLNPRRLERKESEAFALGRAAHHLFLGEAEFGKYFAARPEELNGKAWNGNRTDCREWLDAMADAGLTVLTPGQMEAIKGMAGILPWQEGLADSGLKNNALANPPRGQSALRGLVEHTIVAQDEETGIWIKSRPDVIPLGSTEGVDLKTAASVDDRSLAKSLDGFRYDMQAELAARCLRQAAAVELTSFAFLFVGKSPPHCVRVVELNPADLGEAAFDNRAALRTFARCLEANRWPGPGGTVSDAIALSRPDWSLKEAAGRRAILEMELPA